MEHNVSNKKTMPTQLPTSSGDDTCVSTGVERETPAGREEQNV